MLRRGALSEKTQHTDDDGCTSPLWLYKDGMDLYSPQICMLTKCKFLVSTKPYHLCAVTLSSEHCQRHNWPRNWLHNLEFSHRFLIWSPSGATWISCKYNHQETPFVLIANLATRWHHLHPLEIWLPVGTTCITTLPWVALLTSSVSIDLVSSSARVTSVKLAKGVYVTSGPR